MQNPKLNFTAFLKILAISLFITIFFTNNSFAAVGINGQINFQGKVINKTTGTNVANGNYDFEFRLYDAATSGSLLWTETRTAGNQVTVTDGIFRVALGSVTSLSSVDFNSDSLYLEIDFNGETFTTERLRFAAAPYAFSSKEVNGLAVTNNGGNTLDIAANKTFTVSNSLTLAGADSKTINFGSNNLTLTTSADSSLTLPSSGTLVALEASNSWDLLQTFESGITVVAGQNVVINNDTFTDFTGNGLALSGSSLQIDLLSAQDSVGATSSRSGLEFAGASSDQLSLLQGCADGDVLAWSDTNHQWECTAQSGGPGGAGNEAQVIFFSSGEAFAF